MDALRCESSETTFNVITVKVELAKNELVAVILKALQLMERYW